MDTQQQEGQQAEGYGDESLNTASTGNAQESGSTGGHHKKGGIHSNALYAAGMGRAATAQVDPHSNSGLAETGTNVSYEGATAPGSGGSAGTGYTSGQAGTDASISTGSDYGQAAAGDGAGKEESDDDKAEDAKDEMNEQR